jgi:hypothetical protein
VSNPECVLLLFHIRAEIKTGEGDLWKQEEGKRYNMNKKRRWQEAGETCGSKEKEDDKILSRKRETEKKEE